MKRAHLYCLILLSFSYLLRSQTFESSKPPNILFILADDLGYHDLSITGSRYYETPNIDRIALEGTVFTQGYAASLVCSPSRASIMLGQFTARHGITDWIGAPEGEAWRDLKRYDKMLPAAYRHQLPQQAITLPEALKAGGYVTFFAGKWHLGEGDSSPEKNGYDINIGGWEAGSPKGGYFSPWDNPLLPNTEPGENLSMRLAKETSQFIAWHADTPFFAMLSFYAVHAPIETTEQKWAKYRNRADSLGIAEQAFIMEQMLPIRTQQDNPVYAGLVEQMDDAVGLVIKQLKQSGLYENTIIIFTSDNGGVASGDAFSTSNLTLRGGKGYQWEGGIREPFFIRLPRNYNAVRSSDVPVTGADFYPTLLDYAGIPQIPEQSVDGRSLKLLIEGKNFEERALFWHYPHYGNQGGLPSSIIRRGEYKLIHYWEDDHDELYNLETDLKEQRDLSKIEPERTHSLKAELMAFLKETNALRPQKDPQFDQHKRTELDRERLEVLLPKLEEQRLLILSKTYNPDPTWWGSKLTKD
ncbi:MULTISPECIES: sulfatase [unclassified Leeuwenhoekiella]|uniref:sulfatase n=1 Tax=unclassified Leeuwenhoekiella TaxID=2615029 RepID=UPI000C69837C|nr:MULTISPECIES: sulfatase [unclassified Leeuwenhoekiella]MAW93858.1 sulfatase [Leeuwenhoekiella sp.]MBA82265.1 sulfatase [Leeuwenhoekiella sp.]|tara:strand:+ start:10348 stop:11928 length:1581 start_codon:yes stop_codon:yes gene_type:complete